MKTQLARIGAHDLMCFKGGITNALYIAYVVVFLECERREVSCAGRIYHTPEAERPFSDIRYILTAPPYSNTVQVDFAELPPEIRSDAVIRRQELEAIDRARAQNENAKS